MTGEVKRMQNEVVMTGCRAQFYHPREGAKEKPRELQAAQLQCVRRRAVDRGLWDEQTGAARIYSHASLNDGDTFRQKRH